MSSYGQRLVFLKEGDLVVNQVLRPLVLPALLQLQAAGFGLVLNRATVGEPELGLALHTLLTSQGVRWRHILGSGEFGQRPHISEVQPFLREGALDLGRSAVVGAGAIDAAFAANLGVSLVALAAGATAWSELATLLVSQPRRAVVRRQTKETEISIQVDLDSLADSPITTGIGFFDHMLAQLARHGGMQLAIAVKGDLHIDEHHTVEDTALALGQALRLALGDRFGIERYAFVLPMDETLVHAALDLSGRPHLQFRATFPRAEVGGLPTELVAHFFRSLCETLGATLHIEARGDNTHHLIEGIFKAVARCLRQACRRTGESSVPSTKGVL